jgi:hypothetical protein
MIKQRNCRDGISNAGLGRRMRQIVGLPKEPAPPRSNQIMRVESPDC